MGLNSKRQRLNRDVICELVLDRVTDFDISDCDQLYITDR